MVQKKFGKLVVENSKNERIILYGMGQCYHDMKDMIQCLYDIDFVCDKKFEETTEQRYAGIPIIYRNDIKKLGKCLVIICLYDKKQQELVKAELHDDLVVCKTYDEIIPSLDKWWIKVLDYEQLKEKVIDGKYEDAFRNRIVFEDEIPQQLRVRFVGVDNFVYIGKHVESMNGLEIECGTRAEVYIGSFSTFVKTILVASWGSIRIGEDCMFSFETYVRNTDSHHIFNVKDGMRINYDKPIIIGNHVWVGQNVILLPGFEIGDDSVVGAGAVTSSKFPCNVIVAGNPAKVIRKDIVWKRDWTYLFNKSNLFDY